MIECHAAIGNDIYKVFLMTQETIDNKLDNPEKQISNIHQTYKQVNRFIQ